MATEIFTDPATTFIGFKYFSYGTDVWIHFGAGDCLENIILYLFDFDYNKNLSIQLKDYSDREERKSIKNTKREHLIEEIVDIVYEYGENKRAGQNLSKSEFNQKIKDYFGMSKSSILYYKSIIKKANRLGFDFEANSKSKISILRKFIKREYSSDSLNNSLFNEEFE